MVPYMGCPGIRTLIHTGFKLAHEAMTFFECCLLYTEEDNNDDEEGEEEPVVQEEEVEVHHTPENPIVKGVKSIGDAFVAAIRYRYQANVFVYS